MDTTLRAEWDSLGWAGSLGLPTLPGLRHRQIGQTPKRVSCRNIVVCCRVPWIFLVPCSLLCSRPHSSRGLLQTLLFKEASRCFYTAWPPWREGQSQADTCPVLPPVSVGASGRKSVHFEKLRDSAIRKAGLAPARLVPCLGVPCLGSDLHRPSGAPRARLLCEHEACGRIGTGLFAI